MHSKSTEHGTICIQNNQLPTKSPVEIKDNSIDMFVYNVITLYTSSLVEKDYDVCSICIECVATNQWENQNKKEMHSISLPNTHDPFEVVFHGAPDVRVKIKFVAQLVGLSPTRCRLVRKIIFILQIWPKHWHVGIGNKWKCEVALEAYTDEAKT